MVGATAPEELVDFLKDVILFYLKYLFKIKGYLKSCFQGRQFCKGYCIKESYFDLFENV